MKKLKRILSVWLLVMAMIVAPLQHAQRVYANGAITLSGIPESAKIDETITVTVSIPEGVMAGLILEYDKTVITYESCSVTATGGQGDLHFNIFEGNTATITFKAIAEGECPIRVYVNENIGATDKNDPESAEISLTEASGTVTVKNEVVEETPDGGDDTGNENEGGNEGDDQTPQPPVKSADNSLQYIKLSHGTLSPEFKYNVVNYTVTVDYSVTSIVVDAKTSNAKATIESVTGYDNLQVGENTITIVVVAENGVKATYRIVVTRLENTGNAGNGGNNDEEGNNGNEGNGNEGGEGLEFDYNGLKLLPENDIPQDMIPKHFKETIIEIGGEKIAALSFEKGELILLCLKSQEGYQSLYVYGGAEDEVYPFIKITSENGYVIVLIPDENNTVDGYVRCTLSLEGKGTLIALRKDVKENDNVVNEESSPETTDKTGIEADAGEFYLIYCINHKGENGWYLYDSIEESYIRYFLGGNSSSTGSVGEMDETDIADMVAQNMDLINRQDRMQIIMYALAGAVGILLLALIIVTVMGMRGSKTEAEEKEEEFVSEARNTPYGTLDREESPKMTYEEVKEGEPRNTPYGKLISEEEQNKSETKNPEENQDEEDEVIEDDFDLTVSVDDEMPEIETETKDENCPDEDFDDDDDLELFDI